MGIKIKFTDFYRSCDFIKASVEKNADNGNTIEDVICIHGEDSDSTKFSIYLDKSTAIKFAKTLRTGINKINIG